MCKECSQHGDKHRWYLEQKNYILDELVNAKDLENRLDFLDRFQGDRKKFYMDVLEESVLDVLFKGTSNSKDFSIEKLKDEIKGNFFKKFEYYHGSQVIPLEDALKVIELPERIYLLNCVCKQIYDGEDRASCLCFNTLGDIMYQYPDYHVNKFESNIISKEEAKELTIREDKEGGIHSLYYYIRPYVGALCSCKLPFCPNLKNYVWQKKDGSMNKSDYKASIKKTICNDCRKMGCIERCNFGALEKDAEGQLVFDDSKCFGCGQCRNGCSFNAIELVDRGEK